MEPEPRFDPPTSAGAPTGSPAAPALSVVVLTWNEERNIEACLQALDRQTRLDFEVIVIDAASTDNTAEFVRNLIPRLSVPVQLEVASTRLPVGAARNRGVQLARTDLIAFLSADAEPEPTWVEEGLRSLEQHDVAFGRQIHAPVVHNVGSSVRGLHYHFPETRTTEPARYASNVSAFIKRRVLQAFPFGTSVGESALDDILLTHRSQKAGFRVDYNPKMVVRHRDVDSARAEMRKTIREGRGWGELANELGYNTPVLLWGGLVLIASGVLILFPNLISLGAFLFFLYAPALRRVWRRRSDMRASELLVGAFASPVFDLAFLFAYLRGLLTRRAGSAPPTKIQENHA